MVLSSGSRIGVLIALSFARIAAAQDATVFLQQPPKTGTSPVIALSYQLPGEDEKVRHAGMPGLLQVPQGGHACFRVEGKNPLLYDYTVGSKILKVETPDTVTDILKKLLALAPAAAGVGFNPREDTGKSVDPVLAYQYKVGDVFRIATAMKALKLSSDSAEDVLALSRKGVEAASDASDTSAVADTLYDALTAAQKKDMGVRMLRATQLDQLDKAKHLGEEFDNVESLLRQPLCSPALGKDRLHVSLSIAGKTGIPAASLKKATGDTIASFDVEPVSTAALEFGPGIIVNSLSHRSKEFALKDDKIAQTDGDQLLFRPAVLANFRSWGPGWIWGTVGISGDKEGISDLFLGVTGRFGYSVAGARLALGVGLAASRLPVGLTDGAVGQALPANISKLDKIVKKSLVPGIGIMLMATGF